jgi:hypothetical protein
MNLVPYLAGYNVPHREDAITIGRVLQHSRFSSTMQQSCAHPNIIENSAQEEWHKACLALCHSSCAEFLSVLQCNRLFNPLHVFSGAGVNAYFIARIDE